MLGMIDIHRRRRGSRSEQGGADERCKEGFRGEDAAPGEGDI